MKSKAAFAGALALAVFALATPASAGMIEVVSAGGEYAALHPRPHARARAMPTRAGATRVNVTQGDFQQAMDTVFGVGRWTQTSGYRTPAQEDALRRQGAGTVAPGRLSLHSIGDPEAPGAYDAVVHGMTAAQAAAKLRQAGAGFARILAERAHGRQGEHLHLELVSNTSAPVMGSAATE